MTRTSRRLRTALVAGAASVLLASCGIVDSGSQAFSVDGSGFSRDDLNSLVKSLADADQLTLVNNFAQSKDLLGIVDVVIQYRAAARFLEMRGTPVTDAQRKTIRATAAAQLPPSMPARIVDLLVDISATGQALDAIVEPASSALASMYERGPASTGLVCARVVTVKSESQARDVVDEAASGASLAELARKYSTAKDAKKTGGAVESGAGVPCLTVPQAGANAGLGETLTRALLRTPLGATTGVVRDAKGWHVAAFRPFAEVKDVLAVQLKDKPGRAFAAGVLATSDIKVNPVYGTWNPVSAKVE